MKKIELQARHKTYKNSMREMTPHCENSNYCERHSTHFVTFYSGFNNKRSQLEFLLQFQRCVRFTKSAECVGVHTFQRLLNYRICLQTRKISISHTKNSPQLLISNVAALKNVFGFFNNICKRESCYILREKQMK